MKKLKYSLNIRIGFYFFVTNILLVFLLGFIFYFSWSQTLIRKNIIVTTSKIEKIGSYIEGYFEKIGAINDFIASDERIKNFFLGSFEEEKDISNLLISVIQMDKNVKSISLIRKDGKIISTATSSFYPLSKNMLTKSWYLKSLNNNKPILNPVKKGDKSFHDDRNWVLSISKEIKDKNGKHLGLVVLDIKYLLFKKHLERINLKNDNDIIVFDDNDKLIFSSEIAYSELKEIKEFLNIKKEYDPKNYSVIVSIPIKNINWKLIGVSHLMEIKHLKLYFFKLISLISLVSLLITFIINYFIIIKITKPIKEFEKQVAEFSNSLKKITLKENSSLEILNLKNCFNDMIDKINYLREYEIKSLYSQINPHFLYNTLDTIIWMAEFKDTEKVISITKSLANFFRLTLNEGKEQILLKDEISHISEYLYIQKQRYEDKLEYSIEIDKNLENIVVPKLILQPIVENAIYHGIKNSDNNGFIKIKSFNYGDKFEILVIDNGVGFKNSKTHSQMKMGGIGIENVDKRIKFFYGVEYGVTIDEKVEKGAVVKISFPLNELVDKI